MRERSSEQQEVHHGIEIALIQARTDGPIFLSAPSVPLRWINVFQCWRQLIGKCVKNWPRDRRTVRKDSLSCESRPMRAVKVRDKQTSPHQAFIVPQ